MFSSRDAASPLANTTNIRRNSWGLRPLFTRRRLSKASDQEPDEAIHQARKAVPVCSVSLENASADLPSPTISPAVDVAMQIDPSVTLVDFPAVSTSVVSATVPPLDEPHPQKRALRSESVTGLSVESQSSNQSSLTLLRSSSAPPTLRAPKRPRVQSRLVENRPISAESISPYVRRPQKHPRLSDALLKASSNVVPFPDTEDRPIRPSLRRHAPRIEFPLSGTNDSIALPPSPSSDPPSPLPQRQRAQSLSPRKAVTSGKGKLGGDFYFAGLVHQSIVAKTEERKRARHSSDAMEVDTPRHNSMESRRRLRLSEHLAVQDDILACRLKRLLLENGQGYRLRRHSSSPTKPSDAVPLPFNALVASMTLKYNYRASLRAKHESPVERSGSPLREI